MPQEVFISYANPDLDTAKRIEGLLRKNSIGSWFAIRDSRGEWRATIADAIAK